MLKVEKYGQKGFFLTIERVLRNVFKPRSGFIPVGFTYGFRKDFRKQRLLQ